MGIRFRKSIKLAPGIRMNFSGSGISWTAGPRGASVNFGQRGTYFNTGVPGTGLYARERIGGVSSAATAASSPAPGRQKVTLTIQIKVEDDGRLVFLDAQDNPLSDALIQQAKKQKGDALRGLIADSCAKVNAPIEALARIHLGTPDPRPRKLYWPNFFAAPQPAAPVPKPLGFLDKLFKSRRARIEVENELARERHAQQQAEWETEKQQFEAQEAARRVFLERRILEDTAAMETHLEYTLQDISWPRETQVSFDILDAGKTVVMDVDLPEIEDMPKRIASVPLREYRLVLKDLAAGQVQKQYMAHVHGVGFRIIGETFAALPTVTTVVLSAFSQRANTNTGVIGDEYLYSVRVTRPAWERFNFTNLAAIDVVEAFNQFELRRTMSKTGVFKPIEPLAL